MVEGYKDTQFSKAMKPGAESGLYALRDGLFTGPGKMKFCIPDVKVNGGRDGGTKKLREMLIAHSYKERLGIGKFKMAA